VTSPRWTWDLSLYAGALIDPDPGMLNEAARLAAVNGVRNVRWRQLRDEELPADLAPARVVTSHLVH
jgi:hypothetical protein